jgi:acyl-CoA-binding protein
MYILIKAQVASKFELEEYYTLDEALKLYALYKMDTDVSAGVADEMRRDRK